MSEHDTTGRPTAIVIGASATGLLAAAALADFAEVTLLERDALPHQPEPRRGIPQAHHAHLVWSGGVKAFEELLPNVVEMLVASGARLVRIMGDMVSRAPNEVWFRRFENVPHRNLVCSRPLLDHVLTERVLHDPRIRLRENTTVLALNGAAKAVTGVHVKSGSGDTPETLHADLVVDASGRGTSAPRWLQDLGLPAVEQREVNAGVAYATRLYKAPGSTAARNFPLVNVQANPSKAPGQGGIILPIEDDRDRHPVRHPRWRTDRGERRLHRLRPESRRPRHRGAPQERGAHRRREDLPQHGQHTPLLREDEGVA
jgi:2-polyprenyl-6-methoxyphenol hydroxylase-like FAD-dependent oxidoreductase